MDGRIVEGRFKKKELPEICDWLPFSDVVIDWEHNLCKSGCDGRNVGCKYHPRYVAPLGAKKPLPPAYLI